MALLFAFLEMFHKLFAAPFSLEKDSKRFPSQPLSVPLNAIQLPSISAGESFQNLSPPQHKTEQQQPLNKACSVTSNIMYYNTDQTLFPSLLPVYLAAHLPVILCRSRPVKPSLVTRHSVLHSLTFLVKNILTALRHLPVIFFDLCMSFTCHLFFKNESGLNESARRIGGILYFHCMFFHWFSFTGSQVGVLDISEKGIHVLFNN